MLEKIAKAAGGNTFGEVGEQFLGKQRSEGRCSTMRDMIATRMRKHKARR